MNEETDWEEYEKILMQRPGFKEALQETSTEYEIARKEIKEKLNMNMNIETIRKTMITEELINLDIPEEEISDEERQELLMIRHEMERGKEHRLEDVLTELNV